MKWPRVRYLMSKYQASWKWMSVLVWGSSWLCNTHIRNSRHYQCWVFFVLPWMQAKKAKKFLFVISSQVDRKMELMKEEMAERYLNEGFSGGEKKRNEILQLLMLEPVCSGVTLVWISMPLRWFQKGSMKCVAKVLVPWLLPTTNVFLNYITPDVVRDDGRSCRLSGGSWTCCVWNVKDTLEISRRVELRLQRL